MVFGDGREEALNGSSLHLKGDDFKAPVVCRYPDSAYHLIAAVKPVGSDTRAVATIHDLE